MAGFFEDIASQVPVAGARATISRALADGEVWAEECELECSKHGSTFDLRTGEPCSLPATRPVPVYDLVVDDDGVSVVVP